MTIYKAVRQVSERRPGQCTTSSFFSLSKCRYNCFAQCTIDSISVEYYRTNLMIPDFVILKINMREWEQYDCDLEGDQIIHEIHCLIHFVSGWRLKWWSEVIKSRDYGSSGVPFCEKIKWYFHQWRDSKSVWFYWATVINPALRETLALLLLPGEYETYTFYDACRLPVCLICQ